MQIASIVGARPQFVKAAPLSRVLREAHSEILIHTGQHYDFQMSKVFFDELGIPEPDVNLNVGSGPHGQQTGEMLRGIEEVLCRQTVDVVLVFGDTNSTLAGALAAAKLHIPVAHVESGLRSFDRGMPEEVNRVVADHLADLLFCPTLRATENLAREGIVHGVHLVGDVMLDSLRERLDNGLPVDRVLAANGLQPRRYVLATVHRAANTDDPVRLRTILCALAGLNEPVLFPLHPRTAAAMERHGYSLHGSMVRVINPLSFSEMLAVEQQARVIVTDSGGVQKEASWLAVPCVTIRDETEWVETVESGWNTLVGSDPDALAKAVRDARSPTTPPGTGLGPANASARIRSLLEAFSA